MPFNVTPSTSTELPCGCLRILHLCPEGERLLAAVQQTPPKSIMRLAAWNAYETHLREVREDVG